MDNFKKMADKVTLDKVTFGVVGNKQESKAESASNHQPTHLVHAQSSPVIGHNPQHHPQQRVAFGVASPREKPTPPSKPKSGGQGIGIGTNKSNPMNNSLTSLKTKISATSTVSDDPEENLGDMKNILRNIFTEMKNCESQGPEGQGDPLQKFRISSTAFQNNVNVLFTRLCLNAQSIRKQFENERVEIPSEFIDLEEKIEFAKEEFAKNKDKTDKKELWSDSGAIKWALHSIEENIAKVEDIFFGSGKTPEKVGPFNFTQRLPGKFYRVVEKSDSFTVDPSNTTLESAEMVHLTHEYFANDILPNQCYHFMCINTAPNIEEKIVGYLSVQHVATSAFVEVSCFDFDCIHNAVFVDKFGCTKLSLPHREITTQVKKQNKKIVDKGRIEEFLQTYANPGIKVVRINSPTFPNEMAELCSFHGDAIRNFKIAVLYAKPGDKTMPEIFANKPPADSRFYTFLNSFAERISMKNWKNYRGDIGKEGYDNEMDSYFTQWKNCQIMLHVGPLMIPEQHRRLIGNDICVIIFYEDEKHESFSPEVMSQIGTVPQVFCVVQPYDSIFRVGFFNRTNLKPFKPLAPPTDFGLDAASTKDFVLTKFYNGMDMAFKCPPLVRLKQTPRIFALQSLGDKILTYEKDREEQLKKKRVVDVKGEEVVINRAPSAKSISSAASETIKGTLTVHMFSGQGLAPRDANGLSDPYCLVTLGDATERTSTKKKTLSPIWNQSFDFILDCPASENLIITCMDWDAFSDDDYMGSLMIPISSCIKDFKEPTIVNFLNLENDPLPVSGGVLIKLEYSPSVFTS